MKFTPYYDKIVVEPVIKEGVIQTNDEKFLEVGKVIAVGRDVDFVKVGEIISFDAWGCQKTAEYEGKQYYVLTCNSQVILGKHAKK